MNMVFAICAIGERYKRFRDNLVKSLNKYVPGIDVVEIDTAIAAKSLPGVSEGDLPAMSRLAIPIMDEFAKYDRVVYVDVDTDIISSKFANILKVETSDDGLAAVADSRQGLFTSYMKDRFPRYDKPTYFNTGVIVMDMHKIDKSVWKDKVSKAFMEHLANPFRWKGQDVLNAYFDIKEIDRKFNFVWNRGVDPRGGAYLVHYTGADGKNSLDEVLDMRDNIENITWKERCVVVCPRHEFVRSWMRAYFANGNTVPLVIIKNHDWTNDDLAYCEAAAEYSKGIIFDCAEEWERAKKLANRNVKHNVGWAAKRLFYYSVAVKLRPKTWAWIDDDIEITGNIDECFDYAERSSGFVCTQFHYPDEIDNRHPARLYRSNIDTYDKIAWNSFMLFHGDANARLQNDLVGDFPIEDDETIFTYLYKNNELWFNGFCDFSIRKWQAICKRIKDIPQHWSGKALHYASNFDNNAVKNMWAQKSDCLPPSPFEISDVGMGRINTSKEDNGPIDAVFVIGTGSLNGNEELRYALRNLDKHCKFVRNVYICGVCPSWVDKTVVRHLQWPDRFDHAKDANIIDKLRHACEVNGIAKRILFCSDDQFQTKECSWDDFRPRYLRRYASNDTWYEKRHRAWHSRLRNTLEREVQRRKALGLEANDVFYYQPHIWMPIDRDRFIEYAKWCNYERRSDTIIASGYFNFVDADGFPDQDNPVTFLDGNIKEIPETVHVAYHDDSYKNAMSMLKQMFPERSRFELAPRSIKPFGLTAGVTESVSGSALQARKGEDPSPATQDETAQILGVMSRIRQNPAWHGMLHEVSRAEELRLFGVKGWRIVWDDIVERWKADTDNGQNPVVVRTPRSEDASAVLNAYASSPQSMRTVSFGPAANPSRQLPRPDPDKIVLRNRVHAALRRSAK